MESATRTKDSIYAWGTTRRRVISLVEQIILKKGPRLHESLKSSLKLLQRFIALNKSDDFVHRRRRLYKERIVFRIDGELVKSFVFPFLFCTSALTTKSHRVNYFQLSSHFEGLNESKTVYIKRYRELKP